MAVYGLNGVPGSGKTLNATRIGYKHYRKENSKIKFYLRYLLSYLPNEKFKENFNYYDKFNKRKINNVYSNYPILLDKKNNIYSNVISFWDLNNDYSYLPNACIIIDEIQLYADSDEYKDKNVNKKLSNIAKFLQAHRHFGIKDIIFTSQHPSRIFKKGRNVCEYFFKQCKVINIPLTKYSIIKGVGYYNLDDYGKYIPKDRKLRKQLPFDYFKKIYIFNRKKIYNAYDSRYLSEYNYNKPLYNNGLYDKKKVSYDHLKNIFESD